MGVSVVGGLAVRQSRRMAGFLARFRLYLREFKRRMKGKEGARNVRREGGK